MKYFKCENCGSELTKNPDNTYSCSYCRRTYYDDSLEKAYDRVYQNLRGTVQGIVTEELLKQKIEQLATCRQALYKERNEQFIDNNEIARWAGEILQLSPKDAQATFYMLASKKRWVELNQFMQKLNAREVPYLVEGFVDYLTNGQFVEKCVLCLSDLIDRAFDGGNEEYAVCHKKLVRADERERSGIYDVSLPRDVFVAYSSKDKEEAYELVEYLEKNGFKCFIAMRNLTKGVDAALKYNERLKTAMDSCTVFLLVSSSNSRARDCDAYSIEMQYIRDCDCRKANDFTVASTRYEEYLEKNRKRCKPRLEYLIEDYGTSPYEKMVKKFFSGLTWCRSLESVSDAVFELIEGAQLEETEEEKFAREREALERQLAEEKRAREQLLAELEKKQEDELKKQLAELEKQRAEAERQMAEMERRNAELAQKEQELSQRQVSPATPTGNIDDLYKAFKEREREEEESRKRKEEEAERKRQEEAERKAEEERKRKEEEKKRLEEVRRQLEEQEKIRLAKQEAQEKLKRDFQIEKGVLIRYKGNDEQVVIPQKVTKIGDSAFLNCRSLVLVEIPYGVTSIGAQAFDGCSNLMSVELPEGVTEIGNMAFANCSSLESVAIPNSVTVIGNGAFGNCRRLKSIEVPDSVTIIGINAFACNYNLANITVGENNKDYKSIDGNLYTKDGKRLVQYAVGKEETNFTIPNGVTEIGDLAFGYAYNLKSVTISSGVTNIGYRSFTDCSDLASIAIPDSVTVICGQAFQNCSALTSVVIPDSVELIGKDAFKGCSALKQVEAIRKTKLDGAFENIKIVSYRESEEERKLRQEAERKRREEEEQKRKAEEERKRKEAQIKRDFEIVNGVLSKYKGAGGDVVIPDTVTTIGAKAFADCAHLTSVVIPNSVKTIDDFAFENCNNLTSVHISNSVNWIGCFVFSGCEKLTSVVIPSSVISMDSSVFSLCANLRKIWIPKSVAEINMFAFHYCNKLTIYAEVDKKPKGWVQPLFGKDNWNPEKRPVVWGATRAEFDKA